MFNVVILTFTREEVTGDCTNIINKPLNWIQTLLVIRLAHRRSKRTWDLLQTSWILAAIDACTSPLRPPAALLAKSSLNFVRVKKKPQQPNNGRVCSPPSVFARLPKDMD